MTGLVREGGAFRGLFTADATNAYSYVSKQRGRNLKYGYK